MTKLTPDRHILSFRFTLLLSLIVIVLALVFWFIANFRLQQGLLQHFEQQGHVNARQTANQLLEPLLAEDLVSVRVIAEQIRESHGLARITVHNVENQLLVQAGDSRGRDTGASRDFTAPITLDNSVAGYVTLSVKTEFISSQLAHLRNYFGLATLLAWLVITALGRWLFNLHWPATENDSTASTAATDEEKPLADEEKLQTAECLVAIRNLDNLREFVGRDALQKYMLSLQRGARLIANLYSAEIHFEESGLRLSLDCADQMAVFRISCVAWLLLQLAVVVRNRQAVEFRFNLSAVVDLQTAQDGEPAWLESTQHLRSLRVLALALEEGQIAMYNALKDEGQRYKLLAVNNGDHYVIDHWQAACISLLENQLATISQQLQN